MATVGVGVAGWVATGVGVAELVAVGDGDGGTNVESDHIEKSFAMQGLEYQPSALNDTLTLCVPSAIGTK